MIVETCSCPKSSGRNMTLGSSRSSRGFCSGFAQVKCPIGCRQDTVTWFARNEVLMISFSCSHCGMKIKVKPEFAGRSSKCPTCKKPLVVPPLDKTQAEVRAGQIEGTDSSLAKAGVDAGVTLEPMASAARPGSKSLQELLARRARNDG